MRKLKIVTIFVFFFLLAVPIVTFTRGDNIVSEIDNRTLTNNPFGDNFVADNDESLTDALENYVQDRIGLRDEMIQIYTVLNDVLFHEMVHPTYTYGQDGQVFLEMEQNIEYSDYHEMFVNMIKKIQTYCEERKIPFLFVFNPSKTTVLSDELPAGVNYSSEWVDTLLEKMKESGINYVDNTPLLIAKTGEGEQVFNKEYNAGHWNDLGAFYGVNNILKNLKENYYPNLHINSKDEFSITERLNESLQVSRFPIHEYEPVFEPKCTITDMTDNYSDEIEINSQYKTFRYLINEERIQEGAPKALVFQGSYMNGMGYKFLENSLGEYIIVHDYRNTMNFDYYFNIFQPECVIVEVAEYTLLEQYFTYDSMLSMELNPEISDFSNWKTEQNDLDFSNVNIETGDALTAINVNNLPPNTEYAYIAMNGRIYDLKNQGDGIYSVTVENDNYDSESFEVIAVTEDNLIRYS